MAPRKKYTVSAQLYTLREFLETPADMKKTMRRLRRIGYEAAQISGVGKIGAADLNRLMTDEGINPIGAHVGLGQFREDLDGVIADCKAWDIEYVAIPWMPAADFTTATSWKKAAREFSRYGRALAKEGLKLQYHNHMFEFQKFGMKGYRGGMTGLEILYANSDPEALQAELDLGWVMRGNQCPVAWCKRMAGRLDQVHMKDWGIQNNEAVWRAVGEGSGNWKAIIRAAKAAGTVHFIVEQDDCPVSHNPFKSLQISLENLSVLGL